MSLGEERISKILQNNNLYFKQEYTYQDLKYKGNLLRYDFWVDINGKEYLIEFDGKQHFEDVKFFSKGNFLHMKENDRRKNKYALLKGLTLIRIPYWDLDNLNTLNDLLRPQYMVKSIYHNDRLINNGGI